MTHRAKDEWTEQREHRKDSAQLGSPCTAGQQIGTETETEKVLPCVGDDISFALDGGELFRFVFSMSKGGRASKIVGM